MLLVALAINKQLDLQSLGTVIARHMANDEGWYSGRREVQRVFILAVAVTAILMMIGLAIVARGASGWAITALVGLTVLLVFISIRAVSFHHIDAFIGRNFVGVRVNHLLELGGIAIIGLSALGSIFIGSGTKPTQGSSLR